MKVIQTLLNSKSKNLAKVASLVAVSTLLLASCGNNNDSPTPKQPTIFEITADDDRFDSLELALTTTGLDAALDDPNATFTVFAPTDDAFAKLGDTLTTLLGDTDTLSNILQYHVINAEVDATTAIGVSPTTQKMLNMSSVALTLRDGQLFINDAKVIITDIQASNGIIHAIDTVITPPTPTAVDGTIVDAALATPELSTLVTALTAANLVDLLADESKTFTVFAPLNSAFDKVDSNGLNALLADVDALTDVLTYHVLAGVSADSITATSLTGTEIEMANGKKATLTARDGKLFVNNSEVVTKDIVTKNGTVHLINKVMMPPVGSILDIAVADGRFTTLVAALQATGLDDVLADKSKVFTVFAPTDDAFAMLGDETINALLNDTATLSNILLYHVIPDTEVNAESAIAGGLAGANVATANGKDVGLSIVDGDLFINNAKVIITDIKTDNGIIHVVDSVIVE